MKKKRLNENRKPNYLSDVEVEEERLLSLGNLNTKDLLLFLDLAAIDLHVLRHTG